MCGREGAPARPALEGVACLNAFPQVWRGRDALPRGAAVRRPTAVSRAAPWTADALRRVRRCTSRRAICRFVFGPFHYWAFCERATPDAPETIDDQRRCTGCRYWTIYGGSRGSASHLQLRITSLIACECRTRIPTAAVVPPADLSSAGRPVPLPSSRSEMELLPDSQNPDVC